MKTLLLYGDGNDSLLLDRLTGYLKQFCSIAVIQKHQAIQFEKNCKILIVQSNDITEIQMESTAIFLEKKINIRSLKSISESSVVIINSENKKHRQFAGEFPVNAVSYGFSSKDTITFSSRGDEQYVISLQRSIHAVDGSIIEPMEIPCHVNGIFSEEFILSFVSILLVLNEIHLSDKQVLEIGAG